MDLRGAVSLAHLFTSLKQRRRVGVAQQKGEERAAQVLGRVKATPAWRLSTALDDLGPASRGAEPSDVLVFFISALVF